MEVLEWSSLTGFAIYRVIRNKLIILFIFTSLVCKEELMILLTLWDYGDAISALKWVKGLAL